jgi:hypothetical protein
VVERFIGVWEAANPTALVTTELEDYVDVKAIKMPQRVTKIVEISEALGGRFEVENARYDFNVSFNSRIFAGSVPKSVKRKDWKLPA